MRRGPIHIPPPPVNISGASQDCILPGGESPIDARSQFIRGAPFPLPTP
jgi:hypothetical protein